MPRSKGFMTSACAGGRVAGKDGDPGLTYYPAHTRNGKLYNQRVTFTVYVNAGGVKADGSPGRSDQFGFVAYGALADSICRSLSNGMAIDAVLEPSSYLGRSFDANRAMRLEADGSPVMIRKVGFQIVRSPIYGEESLKTIDLEIATGRRPANWNVQNHPDAAIWAQMRKDRANVQYVPGSTIFGFAKVITPSGPGIVQVEQSPTGPLAKAARLAARASGTPTAGYIPPVVNAAVPAVPATGTLPAAGTLPAISPELLAQAIAAVTGAQAQAQAATGAKVDPKTGFATGAAEVAAF